MQPQFDRKKEEFPRIFRELKPAERGGGGKKSPRKRRKESLTRSGWKKNLLIAAAAQKRKIEAEGRSILVLRPPEKEKTNQPPKEVLKPRKKGERSNTN